MPQTKPLDDVIAEAIVKYHLPPLSEDFDVEECDAGRYLLLERGHYGQTYPSRHDSPEEAGNCTLNQEYAEDWSAEVLIDLETGQEYQPVSIMWAAIRPQGGIVRGSHLPDEVFEAMLAKWDEAEDVRDIIETWLAGEPITDSEED